MILGPMSDSTNCLLWPGSDCEYIIFWLAFLYPENRNSTRVYGYEYSNLNQTYCPPYILSLSFASDAKVTAIDLREINVRAEQVGKNQAIKNG